jgi:small nuclear ribonucleoprotein G
VKLNGGRQISGILRGFDPFMNLVVDESVEETKAGDRNTIGMVVS